MKRDETLWSNWLNQVLLHNSCLYVCNRADDSFAFCAVLESAFMYLHFVSHCCGVGEFFNSVGTKFQCDIAVISCWLTELKKDCAYDSVGCVSTICHISLLSVSRRVWGHILETLENLRKISYLRKIIGKLFHKALRLLSVPSLRGRLMSSSLRATG